MLSAIEKWIGQYKVTYAYVSAQRLLEYADRELEKYSEEDLLNCMSNV